MDILAYYLPKIKAVTPQEWAIYLALFVVFCAAVAAAQAVKNR